MNNQTQPNREPVVFNLQIMTCTIAGSWGMMFSVLALGQTAGPSNEVYESSFLGPIAALIVFGLSVIVRQRMLAQLFAKNSFSSFREFLPKFSSVHLTSLVLLELAVVILFVKSFSENNALWIAVGSAVGLIKIVRDFPARNRLENLYKNNLVQ